MAKNTTIFTLLQNFISQDEIAGILAEFDFEDTARKYNVATEKDLKFVDYSTLSKHLGELNYLFVKRIFELIVGRLKRAERRNMNVKKELLAMIRQRLQSEKAAYHGR